MAREQINIGASANDHTGDAPRAAWAKVNRMTEELYTPGGIVGPQGVKGDTGETGATGAQGIKGDKGDPGAAGGAWADMQAKASVTDLLDNSGLGTVANLTDSASPTATITDETTGKKIVLSTGSRHFAWKTELAASGRRNRLTMIAINSAASGTFGAGIGLTDGLGNYVGWVVLSNGRLYKDTLISGSRASTQVAGATTGQVPTFSSGTTISMMIVLNDDGTGALFVGVDTDTPNLGPYAITVPSSAYNVLTIDQYGSSTFTRTVLQEPVSTLGYDVAQIAAAAAGMTTVEQAAAAMMSQMIDMHYRDAPSGFGAIPYAAAIYVDPYGRAFSTVMPRKRLFDSDPDVLVLYVSAATGSSSNSGLSTSAPLDKVVTAILRAGTGKCIIRLDPTAEYDYATGPQGIAPTCSHIQIESWTPGTAARVTTIIPGLSWSLAANGRYTTTIPGGVVTGVDRVFDRKTLTSEGDYSYVVPQAGTAAVESSGGWYLSGTTLSVKTSDARAPDSDVRVYASLTNSAHWNFTTVGQWAYMEWIDVEGGGGGTGNAIGSAYGASTTPSYLELYRCTARYSNHNGVGLNGSANLLAYLCAASSNLNDGWNTHAFSSSASPNALLISCTGYDGNSGSDGRSLNDGSCNAFTGHDNNSRWVLLNCSGKSKNRPYHLINGTLTWAINCTAQVYAGTNADGSSGYSAYCAGLTGDANASAMWLELCATLAPNSAGPKDLETGGGSTVHTSRLTAAVGSNVGGSTVSSYTPTVGGGQALPALV